MVISENFIYVISYPKVSHIFLKFSHVSFQTVIAYNRKVLKKKILSAYSYFDCYLHLDLC